MWFGKDKLNKVEIGIKRLEIINQWITNVDTKSSFVLAFFGVMLTLVFTSEVGNKMNAVFSYSASCDVNCNSIKLFFSLLLVLLFYFFTLASSWCLYKTLSARLNMKETSKYRGRKTESNIFFSSIVSKDYNEFEREVNRENIKDFIHDLNSQIYINSCVVNEKFKYYNKSLRYLIFTFFSFVLFIFLQNIIS